MPRYHIVGGSKVTKLTGGTLGPTGLMFTIEDPTGWPTGGANGEFWVVLNPEQSNEEHLLAQSRTGNTIVVASVGKRGLDGTAAATHAVDSTALHGFCAVQADDANRHQFDNTHDDHTQYLDATRHAAVIHTAAMLGTDSVGSDEISANAVGSSELANNAVDTTAVQDLAITTPKLADEAVTLAKQGPNSVDESKIVTAQTMPYVGGADPGAVGANKMWLDTTNNLLKVRNDANTGWETYGLHFDAPWQEYTPTVTTISGPGNTFGIYKRMGNMVVVHAGFNLPLGADITGSHITVSLPVAAHFPVAGMKYVVGCWCQETTGPSRFAAAGLIDPGTPNVAGRFVNAGTTLGFSSTSPFDWGTGTVGDELFIVATYPIA